MGAGHSYIPDRETGSKHDGRENRRCRLPGPPATALLRTIDHSCYLRIGIVAVVSATRRMIRRR
ncbi:hypothetical protein RHCRD62_70169 [Rhodococcus sp. RD6.2]|nr:hypothetical protein RHCRD62_70169 [Rhodococcus sp. RD6.2]